jgi:tripartite-type tricarboxylate transporter receptor subunit TctC
MVQARSGFFPFSLVGSRSRMPMGDLPMTIALRALAGGAALATMLATHAEADAVSDFYKGRTVTIVVGNEVGTGFDVYGRTLARYLGSHLPGRPNVVVQNMVGASGIAAANWLYNVAPRDGSVVATFVHTVPFEPLMGNSSAKYDSAKFSWVGNMEQVVGICGVSNTSGIGRFADLLEREALFGATGGTGAIAKHTLALRHLLGAKINLISGYQGTGAIKLAMQRGEVAGICSLSMSTLVAAWKDDFDSGAFKPILQLSGGARPELKGVPHIKDLAISFGPCRSGRAQERATDCIHGDDEGPEIPGRCSQDPDRHFSDVGR